MKFKTFRALAVGGLVVVVAGAIGLGSLGRRSRSAGQDAGDGGGYSAPAGPTTQPAPPAPSPAPAAPAPALAPGQQARRPMDDDILALLARPMDGSKIKDAFSSREYKVNVYRDEGFAKANRLKIDLDRDEKDDEKWTIEYEGADLRVKRQVSPADDGNYPEEYRLQLGVWTPKK